VVIPDLPVVESPDNWHLRAIATKLIGSAVLLPSIHAVKGAQSDEENCKTSLCRSADGGDAHMGATSQPFVQQPFVSCLLHEKFERCSCPRVHEEEWNGCPAVLSVTRR
jgi:hypothetical protein